MAAKLRPMFDERAKERQREQARINQPQNLKVEKVSPIEKSKARDEAGKAAGVNGRYVDMAKPSSP